MGLTSYGHYKLLTFMNISLFFYKTKEKKIDFKFLGELSF